MLLTRTMTAVSLRASSANLTGMRHRDVLGRLSWRVSTVECGERVRVVTGLAQKILDIPRATVTCNLFFTNSALGFVFNNTEYDAVIQHRALTRVEIVGVIGPLSVVDPRGHLFYVRV